jgi:hypothetical protein
MRITGTHGRTFCYYYCVRKLATTARNNNVNTNRHYCTIGSNFSTVPYLGVVPSLPTFAKNVSSGAQPPSNRMDIKGILRSCSCLGWLHVKSKTAPSRSKCGNTVTRHKEITARFLLSSFSKWLVVEENDWY